MKKQDRQPKFDIFNTKNKSYSKKPDFCISSNSLRKGDAVELLKPSNVKNLYQKGTLVKIMTRNIEESSKLSPIWEIKMNTGEIEYCEENFLIKTN